MTDIFSDSLIVSLMVVKETDGIFGKETDIIWTAACFNIPRNDNLFISASAVSPS